MLPNDSYVPNLQRDRDHYLRMARDTFAEMGDHDALHEAFATIFVARIAMKYAAINPLWLFARRVRSDRNVVSFGAPWRFSIPT